MGTFWWSTSSHWASMPWKFFGRDSGTHSLSSSWLSKRPYHVVSYNQLSSDLFIRLFLVPAPSCFQPYSLTLKILSVVPGTTLTLSHPDWVLLDYNPGCTPHAWTTLSPVLPNTGFQSHDSFHEALLSPFGPFSRQTCTDYPVAALKSCLPTPPPPQFQAPDRDMSCATSILDGALRCPEELTDSRRPGGKEAELTFPIPCTFPSKICHFLPLIRVPTCLA